MKTVHFMPETDITERVKQLRKVCVTEITKEFQRTLTDSEIDRDRFDYVSQAQTLENTKANAKAAADSFKAETSSIETMMKEKLNRIETGKRKVNDVLYGVPNHKIGLMEFYDRFGEMIESRKLTPDESTGQMFNNAGEATQEAAVSAENEVKEIGFSGNSEEIQDADFEEVKEEPKKTTKGRGKGKASKKDDKPQEEVEDEVLQDADENPFSESEDSAPWEEEGLGF